MHRHCSLIAVASVMARAEASFYALMHRHCSLIAVASVMARLRLPKEAVLQHTLSPSLSLSLSLSLCLSLPLSSPWCPSFRLSWNVGLTNKHDLLGNEKHGKHDMCSYWIELNTTHAVKPTYHVFKRKGPLWYQVIGVT